MLRRKFEYVALRVGFSVVKLHRRNAEVRRGL